MDMIPLYIIGILIFVKRREGRFISRQNRFVATVEWEDSREQVYVPNTGRLGELIIPGTKVLCEASGGKYAWKLSHIWYDDSPVLIDSVAANGIFARLVQNGKVPELEEWDILSREPVVGSHRFDFVVSENEQPFYVELKSCTLAWNGVAAFPDAVSERASSHVELLAEEGGTLLFFILHQNVQFFIPNYHTDYVFYSIFMRAREKLRILAFSAVYNDDGDIVSANPVEVRYPLVEKGGNYLLLLKNEGPANGTVGALGKIFFQQGFYLYAGRHKKDVFSRIAHHRTGRKKTHWHLDYLSDYMKVVADFPLVESNKSECDLVKTFLPLADNTIYGFGASDSDCESHLLYFRDDPRKIKDFWDIILEERYSGIYD